MTENKNGSALALVTEQPVALAVSGSMRINGVGEIFALAKHLSKAVGFVPQALIGNEGAIAAAIMTGIELNIGPMEALRSLHVIDGKVTMAADFMLSRAIRAGIEHAWLEKSETRAVLRLRRPGREPYTQTYTIEDAKRAGLTDKKNWRNHPAAMLRARAISAAMRAYAPDALGSGIYTADEVTSGEAADPAVDAEIIETRAPAKETVEKPKQLAQCTKLDEVIEWCRERTHRGVSTDRARVDKHVAKLMGDAPESEQAAVRKMVDDALNTKREELDPHQHGDGDYRDDEHEDPAHDHD